MRQSVVFAGLFLEAFWKSQAVFLLESILHQHNNAKLSEQPRLEFRGLFRFPSTTGEKP